MCKGGKRWELPNGACLPPSQRTGSHGRVNLMTAASPKSRFSKTQWQMSALGGFAVVAALALMFVNEKDRLNRGEADERPVNAPLPLRPPASGPTTVPAP